MKKVAVVLSGCGARDGSEIREALCALLSLGQNNIKYECFSLDKNQYMVYDHYKDEEVNEERNMLTESARLARGKVKDIKHLEIEDFDGLLFPGGYGASLNLCNFGIVKSENFTIEKEVARIILGFKESNKPMCFLCISSILAAKLIPNLKTTMGSEHEIAEVIRKTGAVVQDVNENIPIIDFPNKIVSCPCYLTNISIVQLYEGILKAVQEFKKLA